MSGKTDENLIKSLLEGSTRNRIRQHGLRGTRMLTHEFAMCP